MFPRGMFLDWYCNVKCSSVTGHRRRFLTSPPAESFNFGLKVRSLPTLRIGVWAYTGSEDCLNVSLQAEINILFICL